VGHIEIKIPYLVSSLVPRRRSALYLPLGGAAGGVGNL